jgi:ABC-type uncharacterized transport system substrate-binding protein
MLFHISGRAWSKCKSILFLLLVFSASLSAAQHQPFAGKKVMLVNSYHQGYDWSDGIARGVHQVLDTQGIVVQEIWMDTKRNASETFKKQAALEAKQKIDEWQPDLIIAADDNASKYLIMPYFKNSKTPVVFCGINWDASVYGYPYQNATGMEEVSLVDTLIKELKRYARGERIGILTGTVLSDRKNVANFKNKLGIKFDKEIYVDTFGEWKKQFIALQQQVDLLIMENSRSIRFWDNAQAEKVVLENTLIPTGSTQPGMVRYTLLNYSQVPEEQGIYSANTALRIFGGENPGNIAIVNNEQAKVWVNLNVAQKLGIVFPLSMLKNAAVYR